MTALSSSARDIAALRETLQFVINLEIPAQHKRVLLEALTQALRAAEHAGDRDRAQQEQSEDWRAQETQLVESALRGKVAKSWQHADEALMQIAGQLRRAPDDVRRKATELGCGAAVDYALARSAAARSDG
jgi:hypothetical protein